LQSNLDITFFHADGKTGSHCFKKPISRKLEVELPSAAVAAINCWNRHQAEGRETAVLAR